MADVNVMHSIARLVPPGSRVLDLGCLDGLFAITREFDMQTQPHLLLLARRLSPRRLVHLAGRCGCAQGCTGCAGQ